MLSKKEIIKLVEQGNVEIFYKDSTWINKRKDILKRDNNECQRCKSKGGFHRSECVHHVKHLRDRPDLALVDDNLISLCYTCHNIVHPEKLNIKVKKKFKNVEKW